MIQKFITAVQELIPGFNVYVKERSGFMRLLARLLFFNRYFLTKYTTTIGKRVYMPEEMLAHEDFITIEILAHEAQHVYDEQKWGSLFYRVMYLFPQILAALSLLAVLGIWWRWCLLFLVFLVFLTPLPAPGRAHIEKRGYLMSLCVLGWLHGRGYAAPAIPGFVKEFTTANYYYMWPFKDRVKDWLEKKLYETIENPTAAGPMYVRVQGFITANKGDLV